MKIQIGLQGVIIAQLFFQSGQGIPVIIACCVQCLAEDAAIRSGDYQRRKQTTAKQYYSANAGCSANHLSLHIVGSTFQFYRCGRLFGVRNV